MAVRIKVEVSFAGKSLRTVAVANAGYETRSAEILIPGRLASLKWSKELRGATAIGYGTAGGRTQFYLLGTGVVTVSIRGRKTRQAAVDVLVSEHEDEVILSDRLIDLLEIYLLKPGEGKWRFHDDPPGKERKSAPPAYW